jgi:hypothetical protein
MFLPDDIFKLQRPLFSGRHYKMAHLCKLKYLVECSKLQKIHIPFLHTYEIVSAEKLVKTYNLLIINEGLVMYLFPIFG